MMTPYAKYQEYGPENPQNTITNVMAFIYGVISVIYTG